MYHITDPEVKSQIPADVYEAQVGVSEAVLEVEAIREALREVRAQAAAG